ncbi:MAG: transporter [Psychroflexus sp.]|nr:transporter [Psychroflexus sp.]MDN6310468.1 transporter [Psychroflexus sp.]
MHKKIILALVISVAQFAQAQYTETINTNRPGASQGAFTPGNGVIQAEFGAYYGQDKHNLLDTKTKAWGLEYQLRYGFVMERLELILEGKYESADVTFPRGASEDNSSFSNFRTNTIGGKYLLYDPYLQRLKKNEKPNYISWKKNNTLQWSDLIPAVSVFAGLNFSFGDNPFLIEGEPQYSPKLGIIAQHNYRRWVLVSNFFADKFTSDYSSYTGIFTLTHSVNGRYAVFGEFQTIIGDYYSDEIFRGGMAYLVTKQLQFDVSGFTNFKNTPTRWGVNLGVSYRIDQFRQEERIYLNEEKKKQGKDQFKLEDEE